MKKPAPAPEKFVPLGKDVMHPNPKKWEERQNMTPPKRK
jgi:hypothetical protein